MATNEFNVTNTSLTKIQPDILGFGIADFADQLQFAENDVLRRIREEWWERYRHQVRYKDITKITSVEMDSSKLTDSQWTQSVVYLCLWKYVYPILTKWRDPETGEGKDAFQVQIDFYRDRYDEEFQAILRDGVEYDEDGGGTVSDSEKEALHSLRLVR
tara:strand:- start:19695 stop:20171 length:477 start_codon:yes stop_codon:yes gene_type:complete